MRYKRLHQILLLLSCLSLLSCSALSRTKSKPSASAPSTEQIASMIKRGEKLLGKPYRHRHSSGWTLDCSGYVGYLFSTLGIKIPRTSSALSQYVDRVKDPQPGDLLFFKGRNTHSSRVGHVALVVENNDGDLVIMHSTNNGGIIRHRLKGSTYFKKRYLHAGRIPALSRLSPDSQRKKKKKEQVRERVKVKEHKAGEMIKSEPLELKARPSVSYLEERHIPSL